MSLTPKLLVLAMMCVCVPWASAAQEGALFDGKPVVEWVEQLKLGFKGGEFQIFGKIGTAAVPAIPSLAELLKHPDYEVRIVTALAVEEVAKAVVRERRLAEPSKRRDLAVLQPAVLALIPLLGDADPKDKGEVVASRAEQALTEAVAVPELTAAARDKSKPIMVRARAIKCLAKIGPAAIDSLAALRSLLADKAEDALVRGESNAAIKKIERTPD